MIAQASANNLSNIAERNAETEAEFDYIFAFRDDKIPLAKNGAGNALSTGSESCGWVNKTMKQEVAHIAFDSASAKFYSLQNGLLKNLRNGT
jgi:hypothetical protein